MDEQERSAWLSRRISGRRPKKPFAPLTHRCPDCHSVTTLMGRAFRAPRQNDVERWRAAEILARAGFTFWSSVGQLPETVADALSFVEANRKRSDGEKLSERILKDSA